MKIVSVNLYLYLALTMSAVQALAQGAMILTTQGRIHLIESLGGGTSLLEEMRNQHCDECLYSAFISMLLAYFIFKKKSSFRSPL